MQKRGGGRGGRGRFRGGSTRLKGLFADNIWQCDCSPRLPAEHFRVKKEGKNKGKWFYTCQQQDPNRCGFFLWDEDGKPREATTVMSNSNSEVQQTRHQDHQEGWNAGRTSVPGKGLFSAVKQERDVTRSPTLSPYDTPQSGSKRSLASTGFEHSDNEDWGLEDNDNDEILRVADSYDTPHKAQKIGVYATPTTAKSTRKLPWLEESLSRTKPNENHLSTPSKTPTTVLDTRAPPKSPSPQARFKDALVNPADSASSLTSEVLAQLPKLPPDKLSILRTILSRHDLKAQGVAKGRDISRLALKAKEAKIIELQSKIVRLEAEREVDRGVIQKLRWDRQNVQAGDETEGDDNDELWGRQSDES